MKHLRSLSEIFMRYIKFLHGVRKVTSRITQNALSATSRFKYVNRLRYALKYEITFHMLRYATVTTFRTSMQKIFFDTTYTLSK